MKSTEFYLGRELPTPATSSTALGDFVTVFLLKLLTQDVSARYFQAYAEYVKSNKSHHGAAQSEHKAKIEVAPGAKKGAATSASH